MTRLARKNVYGVGIFLKGTIFFLISKKRYFSYIIPTINNFLVQSQQTASFLVHNTERLCTVLFGLNTFPILYPPWLGANFKTWLRRLKYPRLHLGYIHHTPIPHRNIIQNNWPRKSSVQKTIAHILSQ